MQKPSIILAVLALASVTACAAPEQVTARGSSSTDVTAQSREAETAALNAQLESLRSSCEAKMSDHALDPIRGKIELMRDIPEGGDNGPPPLSIVMNNTTPTDEEKAAIQIWAKIYGECIRQEYKVTETWVTPQITSLGRQIDQKVTALIIALIEGRITYSLFATTRVDIANQQLTAIELLEKGGLTSQQALSRASQIMPVNMPEVAIEGTDSTPEPLRPKREVKIKEYGNTYALSAQVNGSVTVDFVLDSGASDVQIPADVFRTLIRTGTVSERDLLDEQAYSLADGSEVRRTRFMLRTLEIGGHIISNVLASVGPLASDPLLGQSFLSRLNSWTLDNARHVLILSGKPSDHSGLSTARRPDDP